MAQSIAKKSIVETTITFNWADDTETVIDCLTFSDAIRERSMMHGFSQKLGDSYAKSESVSIAKEKFNLVLEGLVDGDWARKGVATGGLWIEAIAIVTGETQEQVLAKWQEMDDETRKGILKHPDVIVARKQIDLQRAQAKVGESTPLVLS